MLRELGKIDGPSLIFGGPYSNLHALDALLAVAKAQNIPTQNIITTGDIVAYAADGRICISRIRDAGIHVVAGNCEKQLAEGADDCGCGFEEGSTCSILSRGWYAHALATIPPEDRAWLGKAPDFLTFENQGKRCGVIHGGVSNIAKFLWPVSSDDDLNAEWSELEKLTGPLDMIIAGHSGIAFQRQLSRGTWINAGTIGMPENDGKPETSYVILDGSNARICRLAYDHEGAARAMETAGLTQGYHEALRSGHWPSEDVLPASMRRKSS